MCMCPDLHAAKLRRFGASSSMNRENERRWPTLVEREGWNRFSERSIFVAERLASVDTVDIVGISLIADDAAQRSSRPC